MYSLYLRVFYFQYGYTFVFIGSIGLNVWLFNWSQNSSFGPTNVWIGAKAGGTWGPGGTWGSWAWTNGAPWDWENFGSGYPNGESVTSTIYSNLLICYSLFLSITFLLSRRKHWTEVFVHVWPRWRMGRRTL